MTKAERDLLMAVAAWVGGWGNDLSEVERREMLDLANVEHGQQPGQIILARMRAVAAEQA